MSRRMRACTTVRLIQRRGSPTTERAFNPLCHREGHIIPPGACDDLHTQQHIVFNRLTDLINIRRQQPAFHPNATQFTLQLGPQIFGFWRQSLDRQQSIFSISNISNQSQPLSLADINLIATDSWMNLINQELIPSINRTLQLQPYQTLWISNRDG